MAKQDIIKAAAEKSGLDISFKDAEKLVDALFEEIASQAETGRVQIKKLGLLSSRRVRLARLVIRRQVRALTFPSPNVLRSRLPRLSNLSASSSLCVKYRRGFKFGAAPSMF
jgi:nucleoid DNA-binding protein